MRETERITSAGVIHGGNVMWIVKDYEDNVVPHVAYPHEGDGDLYDCPACEVIMAETCGAFTGEGEGRCPACGEPIPYCQGHGEIGDPDGYAALQAHDRGDHSVCAVWEINPTPAWIDPACGCERSPDVSRSVPCPDHYRVNLRKCDSPWGEPSSAGAPF